MRNESHWCCLAFTLQPCLGSVSGKPNTYPSYLCIFFDSLWPTMFNCIAKCISILNINNFSYSCCCCYCLCFCCCCCVQYVHCVKSYLNKFDYFFTFCCSFANGKNSQRMNGGTTKHWQWHKIAVWLYLLSCNVRVKPNDGIVWHFGLKAERSGWTTDSWNSLIFNCLIFFCGLSLKMVLLFSFFGGRIKVWKVNVDKSWKRTLSLKLN